MRTSSEQEARRTSERHILTPMLPMLSSIVQARRQEITYRVCGRWLVSVTPPRAYSTPPCLPGILRFHLALPTRYPVWPENKNYVLPGLVVHAFDTNTQEAEEAGGSL